MLGLLSVLLLVGLSLFQRMRSHTHTITLVDQSLILRNVLESQAADVFQFIRREANRKDSPFYTLFRSGSTSGDRTIPLAGTGYESTNQFRQLVREYQGGPERDWSVEENPVVVLKGLRPLSLPDMLYFADAAQTVQEYEGGLSITCNGGFGERRFRLTAEYPFKVTFVLLPMLREFAWFFDQLHLEQPTEGNQVDRLNILPVENDEIPDGNWPLVLDTLAMEMEEGNAGEAEDGSRTTIELGNPDTNGKVFFGAEQQPIFLHLAGERQPTSAIFSDLGMVKPSHFNIDLDGADKMFLENLGIVGVSQSVRGFSKFLGPPVSPSSIRSTSWIFGFCEEMSPTAGSEEGFGRILQLDRFLAQDPGYTRLNRSPDLWTKSSALKPFGLSKDPLFFQQALARGISPTEAVGYSVIPARQIFGNVFRRFIMLSFFVVPSCALGEGEIMTYQPDANYRLVAQQIRGSAEFQPPPGTTYQDFMSKVVSGDPGRAVDGYSSLIQPYHLRPGGKMGNPLSHQDYRGVDGLRISASSSFDRYRQDFLQVTSPGTGAASDADNGLRGRISAYHNDGMAFLLTAKGIQTRSEPSDRFWVGGTVVVDGALDLSEGIQARDIRGGIVIVNGPLTLGNVIPGRVAELLGGSHLEEENLIANLNEVVERMEPEELLTFVVLEGHPITLTGQKYIGIHLVSLHDGPTPLAVSTQPLCFFGALALSRPDTANLVRTLPRGSAFFYHPDFAVQQPPLAVTMDTTMLDYEFALQ
jgi:hypothetical protein